MSYADFIASKQRYWGGAPIAQEQPLPSLLFDWQAAIVRWALRKGRAAIFADCGLGKSFQQIAWADQVPGRVLILAPLCVAEQTVAEGAKTFEIRRDDRGFCVGDVLRLREWQRLRVVDGIAEGEYTGREMHRAVTYILSGIGLEPGVVCMGLGSAPEATAEGWQPYMSKTTDDGLFRVTIEIPANPPELVLGDPLNGLVKVLSEAAVWVFNRPVSPLPSTPQIAPSDQEPT